MVTICMYCNSIPLSCVQYLRTCKYILYDYIALDYVFIFTQELHSHRGQTVESSSWIISWSPPVSHWHYEQIWTDNNSWWTNATKLMCFTIMCVLCCVVWLIDYGVILKFLRHSLVRSFNGSESPLFGFPSQEASHTVPLCTPDGNIIKCYFQQW